MSNLSAALREMAKKYESDIRFNWPDGYHEMCKIMPPEYPYVGTVLYWIELMNEAADALDLKAKQQSGETSA